MYEGLLKQYKEYLPITEKTPQIALAEGNTPLIPLKNLQKSWELLCMGSTKV